MTWVRLADDFYDHPKVLAAGPVAAYVWACGLAYANRYLTDGYLPRAAVRRLADVEDPYRLAQRLVDVGLWVPADDGWQIHDFAEYQPSSDSVRAERDANRERMRTWRERQKSGRDSGDGNSVTNGVTNASVTGSPDPAVNPVPVTLPAGRTPTPQPPSPQAGPGERAQTTNQRRRSRSQGVTTATAPPQREVPADLTPPTEADHELWGVARDRLTDGWLPANAEKAAAFEPLGRDPSGWLWIRAPAWAASVAGQQQVASALVGAGDPFGAGVVLVEGP